MRLLLLLALLLSPLSSAYTIGDALTGKQKRQLRAVAGRLAAAKELRSVIVADPARSAVEVSKELDMNELVRARFPHVEKKREVSENTIFRLALGTMLQQLRLHHVHAGSSSCQ